MTINIETGKELMDLYYTYKENGKITFLDQFLYLSKKRNVSISDIASIIDKNELANFRKRWKTIRRQNMKSKGATFRRLKELLTNKMNCNGNSIGKKKKQKVKINGYTNGHKSRPKARLQIIR